MIRLIAVFIVVFVFLVPPARADVFRNFIWGASPNDVREFETAYYYDDKDGLSFFEDVGRTRRVYRYDFKDNGLWRIRVSYMDLHRPYTQEVLDIVADAHAELTKKFGEPSHETLVWLEPEYRRHGKFFERAFAMGHVRIETMWQTADTAVHLRAWKGDPYYELQYTIENRKPDNSAAPVFQPFRFNE